MARKAAVVLLGTLLCLGLAACGGEGSSSSASSSAAASRSTPFTPGPTTGAPNPDSLADKPLQDFVTACRHSLDTKRSVQLDYLSSVTMITGEWASFYLSADARTIPLPARSLVPTGTPTAVPVYALCVLGAKLESPDGSVVITNRRAGDDGWEYQHFNEGGVLDWTWDLRSGFLGTHALNLYVEPLVEYSNGSSSRIAPRRFIASVDVTNPPPPTPTPSPPPNAIQKSASWISENMGALTVIGGAISTVTIGLLLFFGKFRKHWREAVGDEKRDGEAGAGQDEPPKDAKPGTSPSVEDEDEDRDKSFTD
jgi:hypothetical protein